MLYLFIRHPTYPVGFCFTATQSAVDQSTWNVATGGTRMLVTCGTFFGTLRGIIGVTAEVELERSDNLIVGRLVCVPMYWL